MRGAFGLWRQPEPVPERPYRAKLELTYHCNLRCGFCYTDSPRRTLERAPGLDDRSWHRIVQESIELGIGEAVITGGEPLLRRDAALEAIGRFDQAGVTRIVLNTNGWFVDRDVADRLARARALEVHVSVDGPTPEVHDAVRGVPGSWRRAIRAADLLLSRGVQVRILHVITPDNQRALPAFLDAMWLLGVRALSLTPVVPVGAAARSGRWRVDRLRVYKDVRSFHLRTEGDPAVAVENGLAGRLSTPEYTPESFMVRPNGAFLADSNHPFSFGNAATQPVAQCWEALRDGWMDERVRRWLQGIPRNRRVPQMGLVPYRDEEMEIVSSPRSHAQASLGLEGKGAKLSTEDALKRLQAKSPPPPKDGIGALPTATAHIRDLALARRYRVNPLQSRGRGLAVDNADIAGGPNETAALIMEACDGASPAQAVAALRRRHPGLAQGQVERDVLATVRSLVRDGVLVSDDAV
jgi:MoaA/NifB/PqqE/SkfB family radical SAM enzyme